MREAIFEFEFLTPALLAGADQQSAEMRIPSLRGMLRWWARLLGGEETENRFFGYVDGKNCCRSSISLRLLSSEQRIRRSQNTESLTRDRFDYFLWPLRSTNQAEGNVRGVLDAGSTFRISYRMKSPRGGTADGDDGEMDEKMLWAFLLFGSLGTRSRRAYGSVWPTRLAIDGEEHDIPDDMKRLMEYADWVFDSRDVTLYQLSGPLDDYAAAVRVCSKFLKTLRCGKDQYGMSASEWGRRDHDAGLVDRDGETVYRAALGLPLRQRYSSRTRIVDYSIDGWDRFASPLHFKVIRMGGGLVPIMLVIPGYAPENHSPLTAEVVKGGKFRHELDLTLLKKLRFAKLEEALGLDDPTEKFPGLKLLNFYSAE